MEAKILIVSDEQFCCNGVLALMEKARHQLNIDAEKQPLFKIRTPNWFRDHFIVNNETLLYSKFKDSSVKQTSYHSPYSGIVAMTTESRSYKLEQNHFLNVVSEIEAVQHRVTSVDFRRLFTETALTKKPPTRYMENLNGSFMDVVYKKNKVSLPQGYSLNSLDGVLNTLIPDKIPGVNRSMLYIAEPGTYAPWHVEDIVMMSINYHVAGLPKAWLGIPSDEMHFINDLTREHYRPDCPTPLLHRDILTTIEMLEKNNVNYIFTLQQPGEYVVTMPMGWHCVSNVGCNLSEAVNVYCDGWPVVAGRQNYCKCRDRGTTYNNDAWDTVVDWLQYGEQQMIAELADESVDVELLELDDDKNDCIPDYRERSLEIVEENESDTSPISPKKIKKRSKRSNVHKTTSQRVASAVDNDEITENSINRYDQLFNHQSQQKSVENLNSRTQHAVIDGQYNPLAFNNVFLDVDSITNRERSSTIDVVTREEKIREMKKNKKEYARKAAARKNAPPKPSSKKVDNYERSPVAIYFRDKIKTAKRAIKRIDLQIADYHSHADTEPYSMCQRLTYERSVHVNDHDNLTKRRDLHNVVLKIWGAEKLYNSTAKGHTEITILRDYFNNNDQINVEYFKECMGIVQVAHREFWEELLADQNKWNEYFGVDERYRIPWKVWQKLMPLKK